MADSGTRTRSSTKCTSAPSTTATATASATSPASRRSCPTCTISASPACGCCPSIRRRCGTMATTSRTTRRSIRSTARSTTSGASSTRRTRCSIRVLTELVVNHTSDQHPWFQRARPRAEGLARARLLRLERHRHEVRGHAHHLHRHREVELDVRSGRRPVLLASLLLAPAGSELRQPRGARRAILDVMRFWLDMGVDALRLDAIPYLIEREGTINENLPETHDVLKQIRRELDAQYHGPRAAGRGQPVAVRRARLLRRRRRVPHGVPLPADAAHVHGACGRKSAIRSSKS